MGCQSGNRSARATTGQGILIGITITVVLGIAVWAVSPHPSNTREEKQSENTNMQSHGVNQTALAIPESDEQASNSACLDCHLDFAEELIVAKHLENGLGCTACHGESVAHGEDEANVTKPDILFGRTQIGPFCKLCHPEHKSTPAYEDFVREWRGKRRPTGVMILKDATCTDCHGHHIMVGAN